MCVSGGFGGDLKSLMEFVVVMSKEPEAVITSIAEPFSKNNSFHKMAKCLRNNKYLYFYVCADVRLCVSGCVLRGFQHCCCVVVL